MAGRDEEGFTRPCGQGAHRIGMVDHRHHRRSCVELMRPGGTLPRPLRPLALRRRGVQPWSTSHVSRFPFRDVSADSHLRHTVGRERRHGRAGVPTPPAASPQVVNSPPAPPHPSSAVPGREGRAMRPVGLILLTIGRTRARREGSICIGLVPRFRPRKSAPTFAAETRSASTRPQRPTVAPPRCSCR